MVVIENYSPVSVWSKYIQMYACINGQMFVDVIIIDEEEEEWGKQNKNECDRNCFCVCVSSHLSMFLFCLLKKSRQISSFICMHIIHMNNGSPRDSKMYVT